MAFAAPPIFERMSRSIDSDMKDVVKRAGAEKGCLRSVPKPSQWRPRPHLAIWGQFEGCGQRRGELPGPPKKMPSRDKAWLGTNLLILVRSRRFERPTTAFGGQYSIQLSYERF